MHIRNGANERLGVLPSRRQNIGTLGIAYDGFRRCFKALTGLPPKQYHRKLQMRRAEDLLLHTQRSVSEIAEELGFHSAFHLSAAFKKHARLASSHWREMRRGKEG